MNFIEDCPVCGKYTFETSQYMAPICKSCGWYPISIPWDEYEVNQGKEILNLVVSKQDVTFAETKSIKMKKVTLVKLEKDPEIYLEDLKVSDHIGFIDNHGNKGYLVYVGDGNNHGKGPIHLHAVKVDSHESVCNISYGAFHKNRHKTVKGALILDRQNKLNKVAQVFKFDDRKELYLWLSL